MQAAPFLPATAAAAVPGDSILRSPAGVSCGSAPQQDVGAVPQDQIRQAEDRLDRDIEDLGNKAVNARAAGDKDRARSLVDRMYAAIRSRSAEHQARLEAAALRRADESTFAGDWAQRLVQESRG